MNVVSMTNNPTVGHFQLLEPVLLLGKERFAGVDIRVRVKGGGHVAQIYGKHKVLTFTIVSSDLCFFFSSLQLKF